MTLFGSANALETRAITVNGDEGNWVAWQGGWTANTSLRPGLNHVLIQCYGDGGQEVARTNLTVWYDDAITTVLPYDIETDRLLTATGGPYLIDRESYVQNGATLTIEPGTTLYMADNVNLNVYGQLIAEGTETRHIRITRLPGSSGTWGTLRFYGSSDVQQLRHVDIEYGGAHEAASISANGAHLEMDHVTWANLSSMLVDSVNSSVKLLNSALPGGQETSLVRFNGIPAGGLVLVQGNVFGSPIPASGADVITFRGANRPGPIPEIQDNTFTGGADDVIQLEGTDAHIEGNHFLHVHQVAARNDAAYAISTTSNGGNTSELTIVRNIFFDCDHAVLLTQGASALFHNNTVVGIHTNAVAAEVASAISFGEPQLGLPGGAGADLDGNIFWDLDDNRLVSNFTNGTPLTVRRSIVPGTNWPGEGNVSLDPRFVNVDPATITCLTIAQDFGLRPGSPALGTGPNGLDMGAIVPAGASISGEPASPTPLTSVRLTVGGPGIESYAFLSSDNRFGSITAITNPLVLTGLTNANYYVSVLSRNFAGTWRTLSNAAISRTWTVNTAAPSVRLNEVLARNDSAVAVGSRHPDLLELYNCGPATVDMGGMTITDNRDLPAKFVFPVGATLEPDQYLVLYADTETSPAGYHLGFSLKQEGDDVFLFGGNGQLLDEIAFGTQVADYSIGRLADGQWALTEPTLGARNVAAHTGDPRALMINEWLAASDNSLGEDDYLELFNPDDLPVALGGLFLTDVPYSWPDQHQVPALSFCGGWRLHGVHRRWESWRGSRSFII